MCSNPVVAAASAGLTKTWSSSCEFMSYRYVYRSDGAIPAATSRSSSPESEAKAAMGSTKANSLKSPSVTMYAEGSAARMSAMNDCSDVNECFSFLRPLFHFRGDILRN